MMNLLLISDNPETKVLLGPALKSALKFTVTEAESLQHGVELLESANPPFDYVVCDYHGKSAALLKCLVGVRETIPYILFRDTKQPDAMFKLPGSPIVEVLDRGEPISSLIKVLGEFVASGTDSDYIRVNPRVLTMGGPAKARIFYKLGPRRYTQAFAAEDQYDLTTLEEFVKSKDTDGLYLHRDDAAVVLSRQNQEMTRLEHSPDPDPQEARQATETSLQVIQNVADKLGFTPEVQDLAKKSVMLSLRVMGNSPKLNAVVAKLKQGHGRYITSHSLMLAEICCAAACRIGWNSASTYLKLSLAAFLHDLVLKNDELARYNSLEEIKDNNRFSSEDIQSYKLHPFRGAEFARKFTELPPDVDTIIFQHHERPDGTGFPRGLFHGQIIPLASLFIISHDMLAFFLDSGADATMDEFVKLYESKYTAGLFKKIIKAMETGTPLNKG